MFLLHTNRFVVKLRASIAVFLLIGMLVTDVKTAIADCKAAWGELISMMCSKRMGRAYCKASERCADRRFSHG